MLILEAKYIYILIVRYVAMNLKCEEGTWSIVRKNVEILGIKKRSNDFVYNITVDVDNVYYANGVLVSNCDSLMLACCGGFGFEYISGLEKLFNLD